jgi:hypothetical protein
MSLAPSTISVKQKKRVLDLTSAIGDQFICPSSMKLMFPSDIPPSDDEEDIDPENNGRLFDPKVDVTCDSVDEMEIERVKQRDAFIVKWRLTYQIITCCISHFFYDIWNFLDIVIIITGIIGLGSRLALNRDTESGRILLSITSVMMWFKLLYFMRPFSSSGPLGRCHLLSISNCC